MKKQLLMIAGLLAVTGLAHAMQSGRQFSFTKYQFNVPNEALRNFKVGETFTITDVDPSTKAPRFLKDATGKDFAENTYSVYPGGLKGPGKGTLTYTVRSVASQAPAASIRMEPAAGPRVAAPKVGAIPWTAKPAAAASSIPLLGGREIPAREEPAAPRRPAAAAPVRNDVEIAALRVLELPATASNEEIRQAFKNLSRKWHPDKNPGNAAAAAKFKDIVDAYEKLGKPVEEVIIF